MSDVFEMQIVPCRSEARMLGYIGSYDVFARLVPGYSSVGCSDEVRLCDVRAAIADFELFEIESERPDSDGAPWCNCGQCSVGGEVTCVRHD